jgi:hypothetical protein
MNKTKFSTLLILMLLFFGLSMVSAQVPGPGDQDGDGVSDSVDQCPTRPGPTVTMGCGDTDGDTLRDDVDLCPDNFGTVQSGGCPDTDGDGILDNSDACPTQGGPDTNRGCPTDQLPENTVPENTTNPVRPVVGGDCTVATFLTAAVNIREYPSADAPVLGTLDPSALYPVFGMHMIGNAVWYLVEGGWVSGVAVVLGGDCGGMTSVHYVPDYGRILPENVSEEGLRRYCIKIFDVEVCWGKGPVLSNTPQQGETAGWNKVCKGIKGKIVCFLVEEVVFAIWDWWNEDEGANFDPTTNPDRLIFDDPTPDPDGENAGKSKVCKGIKGKIICFLVEQLVDAFIDWWNEDESTEAQVDPRLIDPRFTTVFVPANGNSTGDQSTNDGNEYPFCEDLMNRVIEQHVPTDGSNPVKTEIIGDYLVTYLVLNPEIPLPEPEPCVKLVDAAMEYKLENVIVSSYRVQYDSWPPHGWNTDILGGNSTVPLMGLLLPAVQKVREAAHRTPYDGALLIDFLGNSTVDEDGGVFFGFGATQLRTSVQYPFE